MFFKAYFPSSRKANFHLGYLEGSVFFDFEFSDEMTIFLRRISFDGYGCCDIPNKKYSLDIEASKQFLYEIEKDVLDQEKIKKFVLNLVKENKVYIWIDALNEYNLNVD